MLLEDDGGGDEQEEECLFTTGMVQWKWLSLEREREQRYSVPSRAVQLFPLPSLVVPTYGNRTRGTIDGYRLAATIGQIETEWV